MATVNCAYCEKEIELKTYDINQIYFCSEKCEDRSGCKIYIVTFGEYSDYCIIGVYKDKIKAKECAKKCYGRVETYEVIQ